MEHKKNKLDTVPKKKYNKNQFKRPRINRGDRLNREEHIDRVRALNTIKVVAAKNGEETKEL